MTSLMTNGIIVAKTRSWDLLSNQTRMTMIELLVIVSAQTLWTRNLVLYRNLRVDFSRRKANSTLRSQVDVFSSSSIASTLLVARPRKSSLWALFNRFSVRRKCENCLEVSKEVTSELSDNTMWQAGAPLGHCRVVLQNVKMILNYIHYFHICSLLRSRTRWRNEPERLKTRNAKRSKVRRNQRRSRIYARSANWRSARQVWEHRISAASLVIFRSSLLPRPDIERFPLESKSWEL